MPWSWLHDFYDANPLFAALDPVTRAALADVLELRVFRDGERLASADALDRDLLLLLNGAAEVWLRTGSRRMRVATLNPGQIMGEVSFFNPDRPRTADVVGRGPGVVGAVSPAAFADLERRCPEAARAVEWMALVETSSRTYAAARALAAARASRAAAGGDGAGVTPRPIEVSVCLDAAELAAFVELADGVPVEAGAIVLPVEPRIGAVAVMDRGRLSLEPAGSTSLPMVFADGPTVLGWGAALAGHPLLFQVRALVPSTLYRIPAPRFRASVMAHDAVGRTLRRALIVHSGRQLAALNGALLAATREGC